TRHRAAARHRSERRGSTSLGGTQWACAPLFKPTHRMAHAPRPSLLADGLYRPGVVAAVCDFPVSRTSWQAIARNDAIVTATVKPNDRVEGGQKGKGVSTPALACLPVV